MLEVPVEKIVAEVELVCGYSTKHALAKGIVRVACQRKEELGTGCVKVALTEVEESLRDVLYEGKDFFLDLDDAVEEYHRQRKKKIACLRKQLEKLEQMEGVDPLLRDTAVGVV